MIKSSKQFIAVLYSSTNSLYQLSVLLVSNLVFKYGIAFCEASGPCLVRHAGNDKNLELLATDYAFKISSGHSLFILIKDAFPINILPRLKDVPEIANIYCATANPIEVIFVETEQGTAILGVVDGFKSKGVEGETDIEERKQFLRKIGYKM